VKYTEKYNFNLIENTDKVLDSIEALNTNFKTIDTELCDYETAMTNLIEGDGI
jgi:hypothetical protein